MDRFRPDLMRLEEVRAFLDALPSQEQRFEPQFLWHHRLGNDATNQNWTFDALQPEGFEALCYSLIAARYDMIGRGAMPSGGQQHGMDFYAWERTPQTRLVAFEVKHKRIADRMSRGAHLTGHDVARTVTRFLERRPGDWFGRFVIMTAADLAREGAAQKQAWTARMLQDHGVELEVWTRREILQELSRTPEVAAQVTDKAGFERLCGPYYRHVERTAEAIAVGRQKAADRARMERPRALLTPTLRSTEDGAIWSDGIVEMAVAAPHLRQPGSLTISIMTPEHTGHRMVLDHHAILGLLWPGHNTGQDWSKREWTAPSAPEQAPNVIDLGAVRVQVDEPTLYGFLQGVDAIIPEYLRSLQRLEEQWDAHGFRFRHEAKQEPHPVLCGMPWWLWQDIITFTAKHDFGTGDSRWHMFDHSPIRLQPFHRQAGDDHEAGFHACLRPIAAPLEPVAYAAEEAILDLLWEPPDGFLHGPLGSRGYWPVVQTFKWLEEDLLPQIFRWHPAQNHRIRALKSRFNGLFGGDTFTRPIQDYKKEFTVGLEENPDELNLRSAIVRLQVHIYGPHGVTLAPSDFCALLDQFALLARSVRHHNLHYPASRLGLNEEAMESPEALAQGILQRRQKWGDRDPSEKDLDLAMRALRSLIEDNRPALSQQGRHHLASALRPLADSVEERLLVQRHMEPSERF